MTQFASSLHPQTNPTNPVLLELREDIEEDSRRGISVADSIENALIMCSPTFWGYGEATARQLNHARRVLERLASLTG